MLQASMNISREIFSSLNSYKGMHGEQLNK